MSIDAVRAHLAIIAPDIRILETGSSSATVAEAALAHRVHPAQIAKTLSLKSGAGVVLLLLAGNTRLNNRKWKQQFGAKATMLTPDEVFHWTGHPIGGVCPFGLPHSLEVFVDASLRRFEVVYPAAGAVNAAIAISPARLAAITRATWVDVSEETGTDGAREIPG